MQPSPERKGLLALLSSGIPTPDGPTRRLTLPRPEEVEASDSEGAADFKLRREALFKVYNDLRDRICHLQNNLDICRLALLAMLFGSGSGTVGECWQGVYVAHCFKQGILNHYNQAVQTIIASGCVQVTEPD